MEEFAEILYACPLFAGITADELQKLLTCLGARVRRTAPGEMILAEGEPARSVGIVLRGAVQVVRTDYDGNRSIVAHIPAGGLFCETFACAAVSAIPVGVVAAEAGALMMLDCRRILCTCSSACGFHGRLITNLLAIVAAKNLQLNRRLEIASKRTTRDKLMTFLLLEAKRCGSSTFTVPYDRQALADFLGVDRSGLSVEIGRLQREGVLISRRRTFTLLPRPENIFSKK